ncbi:MAG: IS200/IS605 family transposase [Myxococcota bacterium]|nr:IS200/IS605 family transposase [Myxococcota bacterium]
MTHRIFLRDRQRTVAVADESFVPRRSPALLLVHVVWATRRRRPLLPPAFDATLCATLGDKARGIGCILHVAGCASDHVHAVVRVAPTVKLADLVRQMKGGSSRDINDHRLLPHRLAWQDRYWAESLGPEDFDPLARYIRHQRERHDDSHPAERWQFADQEPATGGL